MRNGKIRLLALLLTAAVLFSFAPGVYAMNETAAQETEQAAEEAALSSPGLAGPEREDETEALSDGNGADPVPAEEGGAAAPIKAAALPEEVKEEATTGVFLSADSGASERGAPSDENGKAESGKADGGEKGGSLTVAEKAAPVVLNEGGEDEIRISVDGGTEGRELLAEQIPDGEAYTAAVEAAEAAGGAKVAEVLLALALRLSPESEGALAVTVESGLLRDPQPSSQPVLFRIRGGTATKLDSALDQSEGRLSFRTEELAQFILVRFAPAAEAADGTREDAALLRETPQRTSGGLTNDSYGELYYSWNIRWNTVADGTNYTYDADGCLLLHPYDRSSLNASISVELDVSAGDSETQETIPAGAVEFRIPAHLFYGWNDNAADVLSTQVPTDPAAAANNKVSFIYRIEGEEIVISNFEPLEGGTYFTADFAYIANPLDVDGGYPDDSKEHTNWWDNYLGGYRKTFEAAFSITDGNESKGGTKPFPLRLMTRVISQANCVVMPDANKGVYLAWQSVWGERPDDADQFFYILWNVEYGKDSARRVTQPMQSVLFVDDEENAITINGQRFVPSVVGTLKTGDNVHGAMEYSRGTFTYYRHKGAPAGIAGVTAPGCRLVFSSYNNLGYECSVSQELRATHYAVLLRYPWAALDAAREAGINLAEAGLPVTGKFHTKETWDSGYQRDLPSQDSTLVFLKDGGSGSTFSKTGGLQIDGGQTLLLNGEYVDGTQYWIFSLNYNGYSRRQGDRLLGQKIVISDESMWASSSKADNCNTWSPSDKIGLEPSDYRFRGFWINNLAEIGGQYTHGYWVEDAAVSKDYDAYEPLYLYIKTVSENVTSDYVPYCAVKRTGDSSYEVRLWDGENLGDVIPASLPSSGYPLPENTVALKPVHTSAFFRCAVNILLGVRLMPTANFQQIVQTHVDNDASTFVWNYATCEVSEPGGTVYFTTDNKDTLYRIVLTPLIANLGVQVTSLTPDDTDERQKAAAAQDKEISHVMLTGSMVVNLTPEDARHTSAEEPYKILEGTFHALLPKGTTVQEGSIIGYYDRYRQGFPTTINDYVARGCRFYNTSSSTIISPDNIDCSSYVDEATGQTMLAIHYKFADPDLWQYDGCWFNRMHIVLTLENSFDNVQDRGTQTPLAASFEIPTKPASVKIAPSNEFEAAEMGERASAFADVHSSGRYAAYTQANINWNAVRVLEAGFKKAVGNQESLNGLPADNAYSSETRVTTGNAYSYRLKISNNPKTKADHIVFYDVLERGTVDRPESAWRGVLRGVDLSTIRQTPTDGGTAVCDPVVYYSTAVVTPVEPEADFGDLTDPSLWSTTMPEDRSRITAIAIDCSRASDGSSFILGREQTLTAYLLMDSPKTYVEGKTVNGAVARARAFENEVPLEYNGPNAKMMSDSAVTLCPLVLAIHKQSDPASGTDEAPCLVRGGGTIDYTVSVENKGSYDAREVTVTDTIPEGLTITGIKVSLNGAEPGEIGSVSGVTMTRDGNALRFVIAQQHPGEDKQTRFFISTSVDALQQPGERRYVNTAYLTSANGIPQDLQSETTYHLAAVVNVEVEKKWFGTPKNSISVVLLRNGEECETVQLDAACGWKHCFALLEKYGADVGSPFDYRPEETDLGDVHYVSDLNGSMEDGFVISNRELLSLTIRKAVTGNMGSRAASFDFTVQIDAMSGKSFPGADGSPVTFDGSGLARFSLRDGESVTIPGVPGGVAVTVRELTGVSYTTGWTLTAAPDTAAASGSGKEASFTMPNTDGTLKVTNRLGIVIPTGVETGAAAALALSALAAGCLTVLAASRRRRRRA